MLRTGPSHRAIQVAPAPPRTTLLQPVLQRPAPPAAPRPAATGPSTTVQRSLLGDLWGAWTEFQWGLWPMGNPDQLFAPPPIPPVILAPPIPPPILFPLPPVALGHPGIAPGLAPPPPLVPVVPIVPVVPVVPVVAGPPPAGPHTISSVQAQALLQSSTQLRTSLAQDRVALTAILARLNVVYRNMHSVALTQLDADLLALTPVVAALVVRATALAGGRTAVNTYDALRRDIQQRIAPVKRLHRQIVAQAALPQNPTRNIGVAALAHAGAPALIAQIATWHGGGGGIIAGTFTQLAANAAHPLDPVWQLKTQPLGLTNSGDDVQINMGSIPANAHGAHNVPAARGVLLAAMATAGYT